VTQQACCKVTGAITEQVDHAGNHIGYIRAITNGSPMRWNKAHCSGEYRVTSTYNAAKSGNSFDVNPPVPKEGAYYVKLQCFSVPAEVGDGDLDSNLNDTRFIPALKQWVLFRALTSSRDGASERTDAARHEKSFYTILGVQYKMEQTIKGDSSVVNAPR
jgi:hypothetical protein